MSFFVAYLTGRTLAPGTAYLQVFRVAGTMAFMTYGLSRIGNWIWSGEPGSTTAKHVVDGLIYGLLTGAVFAWLWPHGESNRKRRGMPIIACAAAKIDCMFL